MLQTIVVGVLLGLLLALAAWRLYLFASIRREIRAARDAGFPTTLAELNDWYVEPPEGQNAAPQFLEVFDRLYETPQRFRRLAPDDLQELRLAQRRVRDASQTTLVKTIEEQSAEIDRARAPLDAVLQRLGLDPPMASIETHVSRTPEQAEAEQLAWRHLNEMQERQNEVMERTKQAVESDEDDEALWRELEKCQQACEQARTEWEQSLHANDLSWPEQKALEDDVERLNELPKAMEDFLPVNVEALPEETRAVLEAYATDHAEGLEALHRIVAMPGWRFPRDFRRWPEGCDVHLRPMLEAEKLLHWEAIYRAETGDAERATRALEAAFRLSRAMAGEPMAISELTRASATRGAVDALEHVLNRVALDASQLKRIVDVIAEVDAPDAPARAVAGERCISRAASEPWTIAEAKKYPSCNGSRCVRLFGANGFTEFVYRAIGLGEADRLYTLRMMRALIAELRTADPVDRVKRLHAFRAQHNRIPWYYHFSKSLYDGALMGLAHSPRMFLPLTVAQAVLSVERCRVERAEPPESLEQVASRCGEALPRDPFNGEQLRYRHSETGYTVYSVGVNGKDEGGPNPEPMARRRKSDDVGMSIRVKRPVRETGERA